MGMTLACARLAQSFSISAPNFGPAAAALAGPVPTALDITVHISRHGRCVHIRNVGIRFRSIRSNVEKATVGWWSVGLGVFCFPQAIGKWMQESLVSYCSLFVANSVEFPCTCACGHMDSLLKLHYT